MNKEYTAIFVNTTRILDVLFSSISEVNCSTLLENVFAEMFVSVPQVSRVTTVGFALQHALGQRVWKGTLGCQVRSHVEMTLVHRVHSLLVYL